MTKEEFYQQLKTINIELNDQQKAQFHQYFLLLNQWNEKINLTAITKEPEVYEKHFFDSILISELAEMEGKLADVGSGAGFPGIPLKICFPKLELTIIEPLNKRCKFLTALSNELGIECEIVNARSEDYAIQHRESFDIVTARAVANLSILAELCLPLVKVGGHFIAMKGPTGTTEAQQAQVATKILGAKVSEIKETKLFNGETRINILYQKTQKTDPKYPRNFGMIKKKPL